MSCSSNQSIDIQGHRGCRGLFPENSLAAFEKAIDLGVHTLELDIAITKDLQVIVSHEPFMSKTICLKPNGLEIIDNEDMFFNLYNMSHDEIKKFDCGTKFHPNYPNQKKVKTYKPLLKEVFQRVTSKNSEVKFNIEIKSKPEYYGLYTPCPNEYVGIVLKEVEASGSFNRVNLQSFDLSILEEIKKQSSKMVIALLVDENENIEEKLKLLSFKPEIISPYFKLLDKRIIKTLKARDFKIIPWTVNDENDLENMINFQVDGIITDYPDLLIQMLNDQLNLKH